MRVIMMKTAMPKNVMRKMSYLGLGLCLALTIPAISASAQIVSFGGDEPIDIKAARASYRGAKTVLTGEVRVKQGTSTIFADRMDLFRAEPAVKTDEQTGEQIDDQTDDLAGSSVKLGNINHIVAMGNFRYITAENRVTGDKGVYDRDKDIITVTGNVKFTQTNGNMVTGERMVYDLTTNRTKVGGTCAGRDCKKDERVVIKIEQ